MELNDRLPNGHLLMALMATTLKLTHGANSEAAKNYIGNVARILHFVHNSLVENGQPPKYWSDLVSTDVSVYKKYMQL